MAAPGNLDLHLSRSFPAPPERVYGALTEPRELARWWGPKGFAVLDIDFDPEVGRRYRITMQPPEGDAFHLSGEFVEVDPPSRLAFTFLWDPPDPDDRETVATLSLEDLGESTGLTLNQSGFLTEDRLALHRDGWTESLERLGRLIS